MKKAKLFMMLALALPMVAWGQTYVLQMDESCNFKYVEGTASPQDGGQPDYDAQGRSWYEEDYDDSGWNSIMAPLNSETCPNYKYYFRVSFDLSEVKENVYYFLHFEHWVNLFLYINGTFFRDDYSDWASNTYFHIPSSFLKEGKNVLAFYSNKHYSKDTGYFWTAKGIFYDTENKYYDTRGNIIDLPVVATDISALNNAIYADAIETYNEKSIDVQIKLKNANTAASYQFSIEMPDGVWLASDPSLVGDRHDEHSLTREGNTYTVISLPGGELSGNDGAVINLNLNVNRDAGTWPIKITKAVYAMPDGTRIGMPNVTVPITVKDLEKGDANNNQQITIADVVTIVNYIVGSANDSFSKKGADLNNDGIIDISDAQIALNKVLGRTFNSRQVSIDAFDPH